MSSTVHVCLESVGAVIIHICKTALVPTNFKIILSLLKSNFIQWLGHSKKNQTSPIDKMRAIWRLIPQYKINTIFIFYLG